MRPFSLPLESAHGGLSDAHFPLTPALSLRERVPRRQLFEEPVALGLFEGQDAVLPLPEGEGWGEGEQPTLDPLLNLRCVSNFRIEDISLVRDSKTDASSKNREQLAQLFLELGALGQ